jgi:molybdopterin-binding protein
MVPSVATSGEPRGPAASAPDLPVAEHVCLALVAQGVTHGWALGTLLAPDGPLGRIWSLSRPLTYRAVDGLVDKRLVTRRGHASGQGRDRVILATTAAGRRTAQAWLDRPVLHLRDVRTELLVKLTLRERAGLDIDELLAAQQAAFDPAIDVLTSSHDEDNLTDLWRRESARAVRRFLDEARRPDTPANDRRSNQRETPMQLSARNQLNAVVETVTHGEVMSTVKVVLPDGQHITAAITKDAAEELAFTPGDPVVVVIKSTEVMLAKD